ncbi:unnamed protein product [Menidia menidia]|uniref:(Atlantic silverside) hypothetical protein n=1 Tax=Menidia menidia TaxID=238744 RepID=A0A8S4AWB1_9TELE|nr:unnamed protein product [Menidia menidia]
MKMLWLTLLALLMPTHIFVGASPLRAPIPAPQPTAGPSESDQEFAQLFFILFCFHLIDMRGALQEYLQHFYGYRSEAGRHRRSAASGEELDFTNGLCDAVKKMQSFFGLPPSGELSQETLVVMKKPRCGLSDVEHFGETVRWKGRTLSYRLEGNKNDGNGRMVMCCRRSG